MVVEFRKIGNIFETINKTMLYIVIIDEFLSLINILSLMFSSMLLINYI